MPPAPWLDIEVAAQSAEPIVYSNMSGLSAAIAMIDHARLLAVITTAWASVLRRQTWHSARRFDDGRLTTHHT
jgi:hypothetical protein